MAGSRLPGVLGQMSPSIDPGTLCRTRTPPPGTLGIEPLTMDDSLVAESRRVLFRVAVQQALRLGAREFDVALLKMKYLSSLELACDAASRSAGELSESLEAEWADSVVREEGRAFDAIIDAEISRLDGIVGDKKVIASADDYRYRVRPLYYGSGYTAPASFLEKVRTFAFLGKFIIWVHEDLAKVLGRVPGVLDGWAPGLAASVTRDVGSVLGIQIRTIAGSMTLSNHAFGLAIDIDAYSNPHVVNPFVIEALNWAVSQSGVPFDFGRLALSPAERGHQGYGQDDVVEICNRARTASDAVQRWLQTHLPRYRAVMGEVEAAEKELGISRVKSTTLLEDRSRNADNFRNESIRRRELKSPDKVCKVPPGGFPEDQAVERLRNGLRRIASDEHLRRIQVLYEKVADTKYIATWEKRGVLTVPMYLVVALVATLGLRWGEQYESSKDAMHFELVGQRGPHIPADVPLGRHEKPRTLERLMKEAFGPGLLEARLKKPALLQTTRRRP
jgi:hypothetical protein